MAFTLKTFYKSPQWRKFREYVISERLSRDGDIICEHCKKPIINNYDIIAHHCNTYLSESNVNDLDISLNPDNIALVHMACHNKIHFEKGFRRKSVIVVYGSPAAGKSTYLNNVVGESDLIIDIDRIYEALNNYRNNKLLGTVMDTYRFLLDIAKTRKGNWTQCFVVTTSIFTARRLINQVDADEVIHIDTPKDICYKQADKKIKKFDGYKDFLDKYWSEVENNPMLLDELKNF